MTAPKNGPAGIRGEDGSARRALIVELLDSWQAAVIGGALLILACLLIGDTLVIWAQQ